MKDEVYRETQEAIGDFTFGEKVVSVFDDMVGRSVPFYDEMQRMITELATDFATPDSNIYDLGCSTGTTILNLAPSTSCRTCRQASTSLAWTTRTTC